MLCSRDRGQQLRWGCVARCLFCVQQNTNTWRDNPYYNPDPGCLPSCQDHRPPRLPHVIARALA
eukprot:2247972-Alexandrium_andersonii.AAC.1